MADFAEFEEEDFTAEPEDRRAPTCHEELFDFLYKVHLHHRQPEYERVFSAQLNLVEALQAARPYIQEEMRMFSEATLAGRVVVDNINFIHDQDLLEGLHGNARLNARRTLDRIPATMRLSRPNCQHHRRECALSREEFAMICFLNRDAPEPSTDAIPEVLPTTETESDAVAELNQEQERVLCDQVSLEAVRAYGVLVPEEEEFELDESNERVPVPVLPSFPFGDKQYVLITDLQNVFNIREDYCLAIIAQNLEQDKNFIDPEMSKFSLIDSAVKDTEFMNAAQALAMIFADAKQYEETLPTEEEFLAMQARLGLTEMGRDTTGGSSAVNNESVNLWNKTSLVEDENQKVSLRSLVFVCLTYFFYDFTSNNLCFVVGFCSSLCMRTSFCDVAVECGQVEWEKTPPFLTTSSILDSRNLYVCIINFCRLLYTLVYLLLRYFLDFSVVILYVITPTKLCS